MLVEEVTFGIFTEGERFERGGVFPPVVVLRDVRDHGDGGCRFADELVREGDAHRTGSDVAWCAACWSAFW